MKKHLIFLYLKVQLQSILCTFNPFVVGSIPAHPTKIQKTARRNVSRFSFSKCFTDFQQFSFIVRGAGKPLKKRLTFSSQSLLETLSFNYICFTEIHISQSYLIVLNPAECYISHFEVIVTLINKK